MPFSWKVILDILRPKACPHKLIRIGGDGDGAYLVPDDLDGIDSCFSPGVSTRKSFEDDLALKHGIKSYLCDYSCDESQLETPLIRHLQSLRKKWLDTAGTPNSISLDEWITLECPSPKRDLLLQMDIEGAEYRNLASTDSATLNRFRIIIVELHGLGTIKKYGISELELEKILRKLTLTHTCVHVHPNNCCGDFIDISTGMNIPNVIEVTFLRNDRISPPEASHFPPQTPHFWDIPLNVPANPPLHLNRKWGAGNTIDFKRNTKIVADYLYFYSGRILLIAKKFFRTSGIKKGFSSLINKFE